jgi:hypothetical protein
MYNVSEQSKSNKSLYLELHVGRENCVHQFCFTGWTIIIRILLES